ncbi:1-acyl-sn-glycerol-3-phosphate acyltransferase [Pajaroellobacter abortibovis]|uniref:Glycerol-3-phosphate acyltransferase n=1 Tax=Pajaroellobacter abortibovis TaxID=1882918 RepID=A0A1L6MX03_9BACT|nr:1-acyl-sn-glycerol-3-phosphate acyltransferase [Pajaroellobacter abortibovis]APS00064.1 hypothetical protein BCY86_04750 [Pajaroellobacter abortibovis]
MVTQHRPLISYQPNPFLSWLYRHFFDHISVDEGWVYAVRAAEARGTVVYTLRNLSVIDFLALDYLTKKLQLPQVRFANDLGLWLLEPMGRGWLLALRSRTPADDVRDLRQTLEMGSSAALFLKRPAYLLESKSRGKTEGDLYLHTILETQRSISRPILLIPQVFIWSKHHDKSQLNLLDALLGTREWPGNIRTVAQFLYNYRHRDVVLRAGEPIDIQAFLAQEGGGLQDRSIADEVLIRRITYSLLRRLERERKAVIGPMQKPQDRLHEEVIRSPKLQKIIRDMAGGGEEPRRVMIGRVRSILRGMEATPNIHLISVLRDIFEHIGFHMYSNLEVDREGIERIRQATREGALVVLPSHKSHFDYFILMYIFYQNHLPLPLIASGDNLRFFPLGSIFRRAGAFFIRRSFRGDRLYHAVVDAYIRRVIKDGWSLAFFLEGGRSRTGKLLPAKVGLLSMVVDAVLASRPQSVYFCPISIGYERLVEERSFIHEILGGDKTKESIHGILTSLNLLLRRYGKINVQFGEVLTLDCISKEIDPNGASPSLMEMTPTRRRAIVNRLSYRVMDEINRVTAVTPAALVAISLLLDSKGIVTHQSILSRCEFFGEVLQDLGSRFSPNLVYEEGFRTIRSSAIQEACDLFIRAGHLELDRASSSPSNASLSSQGPVYIVPSTARIALDLSKNFILHFFIPRALFATALLTAPQSDQKMEVDVVSERVQSLLHLFNYEFQPSRGISYEALIVREKDHFIREGNLREKEGSLWLASSDAREKLVMYTKLILNFLEGYRVAARSLTFLLRTPLTSQELVKRAISIGEKMFHAGEITYREAIHRSIFENAYSAFLDEGYIVRDKDDLTLAQSYASLETIRTVEQRIASFEMGKEGEH